MILQCHVSDLCQLHKSLFLSLTPFRTDRDPFFLKPKRKGILLSSTYMEKYHLEFKDLVCKIYTYFDKWSKFNANSLGPN